MAKKYLGQTFFIVTRKEGNKERKSNMILSPQKICPFKTNIIKVQFFLIEIGNVTTEKCPVTTP
jgi:hypothetical protein